MSGLISAKSYQRKPSRCANWCCSGLSVLFPAAEAPLTFMIIIPVAVGLMPGIELNVPTALVPILNVSLATKDVIAGTVNPFHLTLVYVSLFALAAASIWFCVAWFNREEVLFRT